MCLYRVFSVLYTGYMLVYLIEKEILGDNFTLRIIGVHGLS